MQEASKVACVNLSRACVHANVAERPVEMVSEELVEMSDGLIGPAICKPSLYFVLALLRFIVKTQINIIKNAQRLKM